MGEANSEAIALIANLTGYEPEHGNNSDGAQFLRVGNIVITATEFALWSDPSIFVRSDGEFVLSWGGHNAIFSRDTEGRWSANVHRDPLQGKARWVT